MTQNQTFTTNFMVRRASLAHHFDEAANHPERATNESEERVEGFSKGYRRFLFRAIALFVLLTFSFSEIFPTQFLSSKATAQTILDLPVPGTMVTMTTPFSPPILRGLTIHPENPLRFDFIVDRGETQLKGDELKSEYEKLIKYFLATLTIPEDDLWVNLSPYEKERIIPQEFGLTEMGRDLLAQDYLLKQLMASLTYPESGLGKKFWDEVYKKAYEQYGTTSIPLNTFNKVWIVPDKAVVYENKDKAFIVESHLKVMLEEDYLALSKNMQNEKLGTAKQTEEDVKAISNVSSLIAKEILIPAIEKEVNENKNFAQLRQIYASMILAAWYKKTLKDNLLNKIYSDKKKIAGVDVDDPAIKDKIYQQYIDAFKTGVYSMIKEDNDPYMQKVIPRKYFSGGFNGNRVIEQVETTHHVDQAMLSRVEQTEHLQRIEGNYTPPNLTQKEIKAADRKRLSLGVKIISGFVGGITLFASVLKVEPASFRWVVTPNKGFYEAQTEPGDDLLKILKQFMAETQKQWDVDLIDTQAQEILEELKDDKAILDALSIIQIGTPLDLTNVFERLIIATNLKQSDVLATQKIEINGQEKKIYFVTEAKYMGFKYFLATTVGDTVWINLPLALEAGEAILSRREAKDPALPGIDELLTETLRGKSSLELSIQELVSTILHEVIHTKTTEEIAKGENDEMIGKILYKILDQVDKDQIYRIKHELSAYLAEIVYRVKPKAPLSSVIVDSLRRDGRIYSNTAKVIKSLLFDELGYVDYLIQKEIERKGKEGKRVSKNQREAIKKTMLLKYKNGSLTGWENFRDMMDFVRSLDNKKINAAAKKFYNEFFGELPFEEVPDSISSLPQKVIDYLNAEYMKREAAKRMKQGKAIIDETSGSVSDHGFLAEVEPKIQQSPGGIDLTRKRLPLETQGGGVDFNLPFDPNHLDKIPINGLTPVIYQITPVTDLPLLLGLVEDHLEQLSAVH